MENPMRTNELHKPFIQSLVLVAIVTVFAMVSSKYVVNYYLSSKFPPAKSLEYSSQKSYESDKSTVDN
jgi:multisubunit Na+/H+ antiporter MnhC subunit